MKTKSLIGEVSSSGQLVIQKILKAKEALNRDKNIYLSCCFLIEDINETTKNTKKKFIDKY
jgi:hypothetical protein